MNGGPSFSMVRLRGRAGDRGMAHARALGSMLERGFMEMYLDEVSHATGVPREIARGQSHIWLQALSQSVREEMDGMALGSGRRVEDVAEFLFADIATQIGGVNSIEKPIRDGADLPSTDEPADGALCSAFICDVAGAPWVGRNCDWLSCITSRGTGALVHEAPGRRCVLSLGIRGDIDVDTGVNDAGLWLHLHTLPSDDKTSAGRARFSWLFWAREALERCATLDELEAFIRETQRDRGVIAVALDGKNGEAALFECTRTNYQRVERGEGARHIPGGLVVTNHRQERHPSRQSEGTRASRRGSTICRYDRVCALLESAPPERAPDDLIEVLADDEVEMRHSERLRTIYSAACAPALREIWFAGGLGTPGAASGGAWRRVEWPW